ncbi:atg1, partial [Symbiodinium pilosum]
LCYPSMARRMDLPQAKLADFGVAKVLESEASTAGTATFIGTPHYLSPEVFRGEVYDERADAWALGCVIYEMVCQLRPFHRFESNVALLSLRISQGEYDRDLLAQQCKDQSTVQGSVEGLLQANPEERLRAVDVIPDWLELLACCNWDQSTSTAPSCWSEVPTHPETSEASAASARSLDSDSWCHAELQTGGIAELEAALETDPYTVGIQTQVLTVQPEAPTESRFGGMDILDLQYGVGTVEAATVADCAPPSLTFSGKMGSGPCCEALRGRFEKCPAATMTSRQFSMFSSLEGMSKICS